MQWLEIVGTKGYITLDDFVLPRPGPSRFAVVQNPHLSEVDRATVADVTTVDVVQRNGLAQEAAMWYNFARLAFEGGATAEGASFWPSVALQTQAVLDACLESGKKAGGLPVPVVPV